MDHTQACDTHAADRYLLGELSPGETEDFEKHYFECAQCALAVESGGQFIENTREFFRLPVPESTRVVPVTPRKSFQDSFQAFWRSPAFALPMAAAVLFGALAAYQNAVQIPAMRQAMESARALPAFQLIGASRGDEARISVPAGTPSFTLAMDLPPDAHFSQYSCDLSSGGRSVFHVVAPAPGPGQPITILVQTRELQPGAQEMILSGLAPDGQKADKISSYTFNFQLSN